MPYLNSDPISFAIGIVEFSVKTYSDIKPGRPTWGVNFKAPDDSLLLVVTDAAKTLWPISNNATIKIILPVINVLYFLARQLPIYF